MGRSVSGRTSSSCGRIVEFHPIQPEAHRDLKGQLALLNLRSLRELFSIRLAEQMRDDERQSEMTTSEFPSWLHVSVSFASKMHISLPELSRQKSGTLGEQEMFVISVWAKATKNSCRVYLELQLETATRGAFSG